MYKRSISGPIAAPSAITHTHSFSICSSIFRDNRKILIVRIYLIHLLVHSPCVMVFPGAMYSIDLFYTVWKIIQIFPGNQNIIIIGVFDRCCKFFRMNKRIFFIYKKKLFLMNAPESVSNLRLLIFYRERRIPHLFRLKFQDFLPAALTNCSIL